MFLVGAYLPAQIQTHHVQRGSSAVSINLVSVREKNVQIYALPLARQDYIYATNVRSHTIRFVVINVSNELLTPLHCMYQNPILMSLSMLMCLLAVAWPQVT